MSIGVVALALIAYGVTSIGVVLYYGWSNAEKAAVGADPAANKWFKADKLSWVVWFALLVLAMGGLLVSSEHWWMNWAPLPLLVASLVVLLRAIKPLANRVRMGVALSATVPTVELPLFYMLGVIGPGSAGPGNGVSYPITNDMLPAIYAYATGPDLVFDTAFADAGHHAYASAQLTGVVAPSTVKQMGPMAVMIPEASAHLNKHTYYGTGPGQGRIVARVDVDTAPGAPLNAWKPEYDHLRLTLGTNYIFYAFMAEVDLGEATRRVGRKVNPDKPGQTTVYVARRIVFHIEPGKPGLNGTPITGFDQTWTVHRANQTGAPNYYSRAVFYGDPCEWIVCEIHGCMDSCG